MCLEDGYYSNYTHKLLSCIIDKWEAEIRVNGLSRYLVSITLLNVVNTISKCKGRAL